MPGLATYHTTRPKIVWTRPANPSGSVPSVEATLEFGYPLVNARSWTQPSPGSDRVRYPSGEEAAWVEHEDALLDAIVLHVPPTDGESVYGPATGWDGEFGWQAFLETAWAGHPFAFWRDRTNAGSALTCQLVEPTREPELGPMHTRRFPLRLRSTTLARFTGY
ncbi:MAG TPA: hypothetical protein VEB59_10305 [Gemmatimonadales bacterium]|nr:hypothetical protein [Gemmatimonadales bacterium]